jgi:hypothetical protein
MYSLIKKKKKNEIIKWIVSENMRDKNSIYHIYTSIYIIIISLKKKVCSTQRKHFFFS